MGWASGGDVFDPVARKLQELGVEDRVKTEVLVVLIYELQMRDWDCEGESLDKFEDDEAVVEAFRRNDVIIKCGCPEGQPDWCQREKGPRGHEDGQHERYDGHKWPVTA